MTGEPRVRTVLGDLDPAELGVTDAHDHLFFASKLLPGQELDHWDAAERELLGFKAAGGAALVQWTPFGLGRKTRHLVRIAENTGAHVVAATGLHRREHYRENVLDAVIDHLFFASKLLPGQELDHWDAAERELLGFKAAGGAALVQWTPFGLGRKTSHLVRIAENTGVHVVAATGLHRREHYRENVLDAVVDHLARLFAADLTEGTQPSDDFFEPRTGPRAGLIKVASAFHGIDAHARLTMTAAAIAHEETGAPIAVHLERGTGALETVAHLCDTHGVPPERVILGHLNRNPDLRLLREIADAGTFLAFDGPSRANHDTDWRLADCLEALVEAGHGDRLLLGGDTTTAAAMASTGGGPGIPYLLTTLAPRLTRLLGGDVVTAMLVANPARAFATSWLK